MANIVKGTVYDSDGNPAIGRTVRAYRRDTGALLAAALTVAAGNVGVYNPWTVSSLPSNVTASENNYKLTRSGGSDSVRIVSHPTTKNSGKVAVRFLVNSATSGVSGPAVGILNGSAGSYLGGTSGGYAFWPNSSSGNEFTYNNNSGTSRGDLGAFAPGTNTEVMLEIDFDAGKLWFGVAGTFVNSGDPAAGTNPTYTFTPGTTFSLVADMYYQGDIRLLVPSEFTTAASSGFTPGWTSAVVAVDDGQYVLNTGSYTDEVQIICLDDDTGTLENDLILRTLTVSA